MKKILIRAGMSPLDNFPPEYFLTHDALGNNIGNALYAYSIFRMLTLEDTQIVPTYYKYTYSDEEVEQINAEYSCFVIPLANAFKSYFMKELRGLTSFVKRLNIPCIVVGVGTNVMYGESLEQRLPFEDDIRDFFRAVLEKSALVGVRGEITANYLSKLGFKEGTDHMAIGCPSLYSFGPELQIRDTSISPESRIVVNYSDVAPDNILEFTNYNLRLLKDPYVVCQTNPELRYVYAGNAWLQSSDRKVPVKTLVDPIYRQDRIKFPINIPSWLDFMKKADFCFGSRLHGNIAALLAGTPILMVCKDYRMQELSEYHNIPWVSGDKLQKNTDVFKLLENIDLKSPLTVHEENFCKFIKFLDSNGLDHIYKNGNVPSVAPLDKQMEQINYHPIIGSIAGCTTDEFLDRMSKFHPANRSKLIKRRDKIELLEKQLGELKKENAEMKKTLNKKSVKYALKFGGNSRK